MSEYSREHVSNSVYEICVAACVCMRLCMCKYGLGVGVRACVRNFMNICVCRNVCRNACVKMYV